MKDLVVNVKYTQKIRLVASLTRQKRPMIPRDPLLVMLEYFDLGSLEEATLKFRKMYIAFALRKCGTQMRTAEALKCHRNTVSAALNDFGARKFIESQPRS